MRPLLDVTPTPEQLKILSRNRPGIEVIRGAAGSGKTTTALLRLRSLAGLFLSRKQRTGDPEPVRILVLTYNRTLKGYIESLARQQVPQGDELGLEVSTFARWAKRALGPIQIIGSEARKAKLAELAQPIGLPNDFLLSEVEYVMSRFLPQNLEDYLTARRHGRGAQPRMEKQVRQSLIEDVIQPYQEWIDENGLWDWNDLAVHFATQQVPRRYDIVIADETQDFSANQVRAIRNQVNEQHCITFIVDSAQRIYARGFTWQEVGITIRPDNSHRLKVNYRNTKEIAQFASPLLNGIQIDDDGTLPNFEACERSGPVPIVITGSYSRQIDYLIARLEGEIDLEEESIALLHPLGGGWFVYLRSRLEGASLKWIEIAREDEWPEGSENIALSTMSSAKGLEFDHVAILGLNDEVTRIASDEDDDTLERLRRLLAMSISRARNTVLVGYKPENISRLISYFEQGTFREISL